MAVSSLTLNLVFIALQIENIDDPVPAVEAILRRCNKQQVNITVIKHLGVGGFSKECRNQFAFSLVLIADFYD